MIFESLELIAQELNKYLNSIDNQDDDLVTLGNIAFFESNFPGSQESNTLLDKIVITLINLEEEATLKNMSSNKIINDRTEYLNPPINLNLYILISSTSSSYDNSLKYLSRVVTFFQDKKVFTEQNSPTNNLPEISMDSFKFILDQYSPTFEESNFLWSTLGGKQLPSVIYKMRLLKLESDKKIEVRGVIENIEINKK